MSKTRRQTRQPGPAAERQRLLAEIARLHDEAQRQVIDICRLQLQMDRLRLERDRWQAHAEGNFSVMVDVQNEVLRILKNVPAKRKRRRTRR